MDGTDRDEDLDTARLSAAFRDAAEGAPPAGFDAAGVAAASRRITRRRRSAVAGAALAVLAVAGVGVTAGLTADAGGSATVSARGAAEQNGDAARAAAPAAPEAAAGDLGSLGNGPPPLGPGTGECAERQDPALRTLVEQVLPEVVGAPPAPTTQECRPGGERGVTLQVRDGERAGLLSVTYLPPGSTVRLTADAQAAATTSGGTVLVFSTPDRVGERPPFDDRIAAVVTYLAPRL